VRPTPRRAVLVGVALTATLLTACVPPPSAVVEPPPAPSPPPRQLVVYGDSLVAESRAAVQDRVRSAMPGWAVTVRAFPGTAQCDWHGDMRDDLRRLRPDAVVIAFSGNRLTECILEDGDGHERAFPDAYGEDAEWAATLWSDAGVPVAFVGAPPAVGSAAEEVPAVYARVSLERGLPFVSADRLFVDPSTGVAAMHLGCLPTEGEPEGCGADGIRVRHLDGRHLCTVPVMLQACPAYSSGVTRYAATLVAAAAEAAGVPVDRLPDALPAPA